MPGSNDAMIQQLMQQGAQGQQGQQTVPGAAPASPPMASPMSTPEPAYGNQQGAMIQVQMAMDMLQRSLGAFDPKSEEEKAILETLEKLTRIFGSRESKTREFIPSEILQMIQTLPQAGGASPEAKSMQGAPIPGLQSPPTPM